MNQKWKLVYRATRDGFGAVHFHSKCDQQSNTFTIIKSTHGNVFGGYTQNDWSGTGGTNDLNAFIFSCINKDNKPLLMSYNQFGFSTYCAPKSGPVFGYGNDLKICSDSNRNDGSYSNIGCSYLHPQYAFGSDEARSFLAGSRYFLTTEIGVFSKE